MIDNQMTSKDIPDWFTDLLILRATDGLDADQQQQFDQFVNEHPDRDRLELEAENYELTVAAIDLGFENVENVNSNSPQHEMPEALRRKVLDGAIRHFETATPNASATSSSVRKVEGGLTSREALAWLAAAAAVTLLLTGWNPFAMPASQTAGGSAAVVTTPTIGEQFSEFVTGETADLVRLQWSATDPNSGAGGEVAWRESAQRGFMVFDGLKANDPSKSQYQLWIFDANTGDKHPIDGGVFDIVAGEPNIVPIDARIPVSNATVFAITEEKPGGVVVSDQKRLPLLAKVLP